MAQHLNSLAALPDDPSSVLSTHIGGSQLPGAPVPECWNLLLALMGILPQICTYMYIKNKNKTFFQKKCVTLKADNGPYQTPNLGVHDLSSLQNIGK